MTFAVGAVTGTVLSFEFGLLWPAFTGRFGEVFGVLFAIEGIFFFLEAIFIAIYIFGWKRLSPWAHFWTGVPVVISGFGGAFSVVAVNSWMNQPQGFSPTTGKVTSVDPWKVIFNPAVPYEVPHMILAAYLVTGFLVASIYAVGMLRGRRDRIHRLGLLIPLTVACIATPIQFVVGDTAARAIAEHQPIKFAAMECVQTTSTDVTEYIYGRCTSSGVKGGIGIPGFDSFLVGWSTSTQVTGLDSVPPDDRPPANTMLHWAFDTMVGICSLLILLALWLGIGWWRKKDFPQSTWFLRATAVSGVAAIVALECGWIVTEVGRQPWIVYNVMRTSDAVTQRKRHLGHLRADRRPLHRARRDAGHRAAGDVAALAQRGRRRTSRAVQPGGAPARGPGGRSGRMSSATAVAVVLWIGATMYAVFGGADFGAGLWSLLAGKRRPSPPAARADRLGDRAGLGGQPRLADLRARRALDRLPLRVRGDLLDACSSRSASPRSGSCCADPGSRSSTPRGAPWGRALAVALFGLASVLTPFFMGTVVGAIAGGRVPVGNAAGDAVTSWLNPLSLVIGVLFVATGAYLSAVFLVSDARRAGAPDLERYFGNRALIAALVAGALRGRRPRRPAPRRTVRLRPPDEPRRCRS